MIVAIVPAQNEEYRLGHVLSRLLSIKLINRVFVILNGSNQLTQKEAEIVQAQHPQSITLVSFNVPLGIDVPRAVGANLAYTSGADYVLFVDGDMVGEFTVEVTALLETATESTLDLALFDCYPLLTEMTDFKEPLFYYRQLVNQQLGLTDQIRLSTPSHGPHLVSRRLLNIVPWEDYAVPPTLLVHAVRHHLKVDLAASIPHAQLGSSIKNEKHNKLVTDTIIGDCLEALCMLNHQPRHRYHAGRLYTGYHDQRRFDLLKNFLAGRIM